MTRKKQLVFAIMGAVFLAAALLGARYFLGNPSPDPPESYTIGEDSAPPFDTQLEHEDGGLDSIRTSPKDADENSPDLSYIYTYTDLAHSGTFTEQYVQVLTAETEGFSAVDETWNQVELPDFSAEEGTVSLVKPSATEGRLFEIGISWSPSDCVITVAQPEGTLPAAATEPLSLNGAIEYFRSLSPASLGISGTSMSEYQVYPIEGMVFVDGNPCLKMSVYQKSGPHQTGQVEGIYLMSGDKAHIYHLDPDTNVIQEVTPVK